MAHRSAVINASRGSFHRPDPPLQNEYVHRKRMDLNLINREIYHHAEPEFHLHIHNPDIQDGTKGWFYFWSRIVLICAPVILMGAYIQKQAGCVLRPIVTNVPEHAHMYPRIAGHLKTKKYDKAGDFLKRNNGEFYAQTVKPDYVNKPALVTKMNKNGFSF